jgi:hypothetical protein
MSRLDLTSSRGLRVKFLFRGEQVTVEYTEPATIYFSFSKDGGALSIDSDYILLKAKGREAVLND